jgi:hypothetical protein
MMSEVLTEDFETGFIGGHVWKGIDGLRDFFSQREGFFDEKHTIEELLERGEADGDVGAQTRLDFFLRRWDRPPRSAKSSPGSASTPGGHARSTASGASRRRWWRDSPT